MKTSFSSFVLLQLLLVLTTWAEVPSTLNHSLYPPERFAANTVQGESVATEGNYVVVGVQWDDTASPDSGVVKIYHATTGALLHVLVNPSPVEDDAFGTAVAISGSKVVVGAAGDDSAGSSIGAAYIYDLAATTPTAPIATLTRPIGFNLIRFGSTVAIAGSKVMVNGYGDDRGRVFVYDLAGANPSAPIHTLSGPVVSEPDQFGFALAASGTKLVVGDFWYDDPAFNSGIVYVYELAGGNPTVPAYTLPNPNPAPVDQFGQAVAISGLRVAVGVNNDDANGSDAGTAYVYDLASGNATVPAFVLNNPAPNQNDAFGCAVGISGTRLIVGAYGNMSGGFPLSGSAYSYDLTSGTPTSPIATMDNPAPANGDTFGVSVAITGTRAVVGAHSDDTAVPNGGSAYLYDLATSIVPYATVNHATPVDGERMGTSVAISGMTAAGAPYDDGGGTDSGTVQIYQPLSQTPAIPVISLANPSPAPADLFGCSVAVSGTRIVVGAYGDDTGATDAGSAYVYDLASATPGIPVLIITNPTPAAQDYFGCSVGISGTLVVIGARQDDTGEINAGSAYVYDLAGATPAIPKNILNNPGPPPIGFDNFGAAVAISGSLVAIAADSDDTGAFNAGSAYIFQVAGAVVSPPPIHVLNNPSPAGADQFGLSIGISGNRVVVGTNLDDTGALNAGSAYVYNLAGGSPTTPLVINSPVVAEGTGFGFSVGISGTWVIVGANGDDTGATNAGKAYVYDILGGTPPVPAATLVNPTPAANDLFGFAVGIDAARAVIGAPFDSTGAIAKGAAYLYGLMPDLLVELAPGAPVLDGGTVDFGIVPFAATKDMSVTVRNVGAGDLINPAIIKNGTEASSYSIVSSFPSSPIFAGGSRTIIVRITPPGPFGALPAALHITSNDSDSPYDINLTTNATTLQDYWRFIHFQQTANSGIAAFNFDADGDTLVNFSEYAYNLDPRQPSASVLTSGSGTSGMPHLSLVGSGSTGRLRIEFLRRKSSTAPGLTYIPEFTSTLATGGWGTVAPVQVTSIDANWERVVVEDLPGIGLPRRFGRVRITEP